jgi:hypothetical protein
MLQSLFPEYVKKWFAPLIKKVKETINGTIEAPKYLFKTLLKESYSTDLKWGSLSSNGTIVAADIVSMNSSLPLKKRDSMGKATGDIPKSGMKLALNEKQLSDIDILKAKGDKETEIVAKIFADTKKCIAGVEERIEYMFLTALSTGLVVVPTTDTSGVGIRADFGHPNSQKFGVKVKWEDGAAILPLDDIANIVAAANAKGITLTKMFLDGTTFNILRKSAQIKTLYAASLQISDTTNIPVPTKTIARELIMDEYGLEVVLVDRTVNIEKNGVRTAVKPWAAGSIAFLSSMDAGELQYGTLAEENHPVEGVAYEKATSYTLVSKFHKNDPLEEFTTSQALVIPVIDVDNLFLMDTTEAQEVDAAETEGDATITIWGDDYTKTEVIAALNDMGIRTASNISDAKLIEKINTLNDEQEQELKDSLTPVV